MMWLNDQLARILQLPTEPKLKYVITDDKEEFLAAMQRIADNYAKHEDTFDNLKYLELLDKIKAVRDGADVYEIYPFLKDWLTDEKIS